MSEFPALIQALHTPQAYPEPPQKIELVQTQISYVFIADDLVYKIKKPVDFGFLNFTTLEKRRYYCGREIELNQRLCTDAYLEVVCINRNGKSYKINGPGETEEYAVNMRLLPRERMMDILLDQDKVTADMLTKVAEILVAFHEKADTGDKINKIGGIEAVIKNTQENFEQTEPHIGSIITRENFRKIRDYTEGFIRDNEALFHRRSEEGKIRDCHGDLHAAHICFGEKICIYDCIEFIDRLRYTDVAADIAFLAMDLDHFGRTDLSELFINAYVGKSGDKELLELLNFYKCYRAYVRGKVGCSQYEDTFIPESDKEKILTNTQSYFKLAESYIR